MSVKSRQRSHRRQVELRHRRPLKVKIRIPTVAWCSSAVTMCPPAIRASDSLSSCCGTISRIPSSGHPDRAPRLPAGRRGPIRKQESLGGVEQTESRVKLAKISRAQLMGHSCRFDNTSLGRWRLSCSEDDPAAAVCDLDLKYGLRLVRPKINASFA